MDKILKKSLFYTAIIMMMSTWLSCTKNFVAVNTDPDNLDQINPGTLLNPLIYEVASFNFERADAFTFDLMQVGQPYPYNVRGIVEYVFTENTGNSTWNAYYRWMNNAKEMYQKADEINDRNYKAIALTLNAWILSNLTDCFGDVPYTDALKGEQGVLFPAYDSQQSIYTRILADLETADTLYQSNQPLRYSKDLLFGAYDTDANTVLKWRKFTNSLLLRLLLRVRNQSVMNADTKLAEIINNPTLHPIFETNEESAVLKVTGEVPNVSPFGRAIDFTTGRAASAYFVDLLSNTNDPRAPILLTQATSLDGKTRLGYKGIPIEAIKDRDNLQFVPSNFNIKLVTAPMIIPILSYPEVAFIKSELALKGVVALDAEVEYKKGVEAALKMWGATLPQDFFDNESVKFDGTLDRIMEQKYLSLFFVDYQQWYEYKRTGLPRIYPIDDLKVPSRFMYPPTQKVTNKANYDAAVQQMGGEDIYTKVWWER